MTYCPETGIFIRKVKSAARNIVGEQVGWKNDAFGYLKTSITLNKKSRKYYMHRLAFLYMTGQFPKGVIDHLNGIPSDNRYSNLKEGTQSNNAKNTKLNNKNTSGIMGVYRASKCDRWAAELISEGVKYRLGSHKSFFEACCARKSAENQHNFHNNHGRR